MLLSLLHILNIDQNFDQNDVHSFHFVTDVI